MRLTSLLLAVALPTALVAQATPGAPTTPPAPVSNAPLATFAAMRVAITPVQFWRADTAGWSKGVTWATFRLQVDSAIAEAMKERGMGTRWAYGPDVARIARRNPTLNSDPYSLGAARWRSLMPEGGDDVPAIVADNLRIVSALGDTRYALIPLDLVVSGDAAHLRLVLVDTRVRTVTWLGQVSVLANRDLLSSLGSRIADLVIDP